MMNHSRMCILSSIAALTLLSAGCRVVSPSVDEQRYLQSQGAFGGRTPAWVSTHVRASDAGSGLIPQTYSSPDKIRGQLASDELDAVELARLEEQTAKAGALETKPVPKSPLDRIASSCPGIESEVNDALTTLEIEDRISKYNALTSKCSTSSDLWVWLGNDYLKAGKFAESKRAFDQALIADSASEEAKAGIVELNRRLSESGTAPDATSPEM